MILEQNRGRVLTVRLTIVDPAEADWIWSCYPEPKHGIAISALSNGDMFAERDKLAEMVRTREVGRDG